VHHDHGLVDRIGRAIIREPLIGPPQTIKAAKASFHRVDHYIPVHLPGYPGGRADIIDRLPVATAHAKGDTYHLVAPRGDLEDVRAPAGVAMQGDDPAFMNPMPSLAGMAFKQEPTLAHDAVNGHPQFPSYCYAITPPPRWVN